MNPPPTESAARRITVQAGLVLLLAFTGYKGLGATPAAPERLEGVRFREVSREVGVEFRHAAPEVHASLAHIEPQITAVGAAVSVTDVQNDGWPDLYAVRSAPGSANALFVNRGDGTFEDRSAELGVAELGGRGSSMGSVWADVDGDGFEDAWVYRWGQGRLLLNEGGERFTDATADAGLEDWVNSNAATWIDHDRDGDLDLYATGYYDERFDLSDLDTTRVLHDSFEFSENGGRNRFYENRGDGTFREIGEELGLDSRRWTYAAVAADVDSDGWSDLYVANDYGVEELFLNRGGARFERAEGIGLEGESKSGMCVAVGDVSNEGRLSFFVTNISKRGYLFQGNNLRTNFLPDGGRLEQEARGAVVDCGWAWGAQFGDLDLDGHQDLVVVNGFVSASRDRDYWYQMTKIGTATGDLIADAVHWPDFGDRSLSGYERTRVLFNLGSGARFVEAGQAVGIDDDLDGRAVALVDIDRDGALDVVTANQRGPLLVYRNESDLDGRRWVAFDLEGAPPNTSALGAEVELSFGGGRQLQVVAAACGFSSQNERRLHFGLGTDPGPVRATVRWPSGLVQELDVAELDTTVRLVEPDQREIQR